MSSQPVLGMLGGGQLGRMTALAAANLGIPTHVFSPHAGPATQVTDRVTLAPYEDEKALASFARSVDVVTYEFENVPAQTAAFLSERVPVRPGPRALAICQHRVQEKSFLRQLGAPTASFWAVETLDELGPALAELGGRGVLKTARFGYDGKGQRSVQPGDDLAAVWRAVTGSDGPRETILEAFVDFQLEASVVIARGLDGSVAPYDLVENRHVHHILHTTVAPAPVASAVMEEAEAVARRIVDALDYVGVLGVEFFVGTQGGLSVNELAPRPHNSGHWTQDGAVTSQFEQHARAVCGLPLGSPARIGTSVMTNLLGQDLHQLPDLLADPHAKIHLYGKAEARVGRKMGHVNRVTLP